MANTISEQEKMKFNGYIHFDPAIEVGDRAVLDKGHPTESVVVVMQLGKLFARVRNDDMEWSVMKNRLVKWENQQTDL